MTLESNECSGQVYYCVTEHTICSLADSIVECPSVTDLLKGCELKDQFRKQRGMKCR